MPARGNGRMFLVQVAVASGGVNVARKFGDGLRGAPLEVVQ